MNIAELKAKVKALEEGKPKSKKWKPKDKHSVRCLPLPDESDLALVIKWHYGVDNGRAMACPSTWGEQCDFCDLEAVLRSWKDENGRDKPEAKRKADWAWVKKIGVATKHYIPMVERVKKGDVEELSGPFLWECTPKTYTSTMKICVNDDWNDGHPEGGALKVLTSTSHGLDLTVELKKAGEKGNTTNFDLTSVEERKKFSVLTKEGKAAVDAILAKIPVLEDIAKPVSSEEASKVFNAWKGALASAPAEGDGEGGEYTETHSGEEVQTGGRSVDETVAKLESLLAQR